MLHYFGDAAFGVWATTISVTSIAVFADLGVGSGLMTRVAEASGRDDPRAIRRFLIGAYLTTISIAAVLTALTSVFWFFGRHLIPHSSIPYTVMLIFFVSMPTGIIHQTLYGLQRVPLSNLIQITGAAGSLLCSLTAIRYEAAFWQVAAAYSLPQTIAAIAGTLIFFRNHPELRPRVADFDFVAMRDLLGLGSRFFILSAISGCALNADNVIISINAGSEAVASFSILARLGSVLVMLASQMFMPLWSANGEALARGDVRWVKRGAMTMSIGGALFIAACGTAIVTMSDFILIHWVGRTFQDQHLILGLIVASSVMIAAALPYGMVLNALGRTRVQIIFWLAYAIISIAAKFLLITSSQTWIAPAVTLAVYLATVCPMVFLAARNALAERSSAELTQERP